MSQYKPQCLINGRQSDNLPVTDRGLHYGDGLFETIKVSHGKPLLWPQHIERLKKGCERLNILSPLESDLSADAQRLIADGPQIATLKIIVTRGTGKRGYKMPTHQEPTRMVALYPYPGYPEHYWKQGVVLRLCATPLARNSLLAGIKHLNRLEQVIAASEWDDDGIIDGIMLDTHGQVIETTMANLFIVKNQALYTPNLSQCGVAGIMRGKVLELAKELQLAVSVAQLAPADVFSADEVFMTNSLNGIWPVKRIEQYLFSSGSLTQQLMQQLRTSW